MTTDDLIESFAIRAALGNNGGTWTTHYTEAQKEHWRRFVRDMIVHIRIGMINDMAALRPEEPKGDPLPNCANLISK
jgi:hypothetical protein